MFSPRSSVRILITSSMGRTNILPSPIFPVLAAFEMVVIVLLTNSSGMASSSIILGRKSTEYSEPR